MGKKGPCDHCGIQNTPLWRNGPPGKPVLCNACGSRWRIRGTLVNYTPKHALTDHISKSSPNPSFDSFFKVKRRNISISDGDNIGESYPKIQKKIAKSELNFPCLEEDDDDTSNGSDLGSAKSSSSSNDRLHQLESMDGNDTSDSIKTSLWDSQVPSRKRSGTERHGLSTVERLHKDLYQILHDKKHSFSSVCTQGKLIYYKSDHTTELGLGCVLLEDSITSTKREPKKCYFPLDNNK